MKRNKLFAVDRFLIGLMEDHLHQVVLAVLLLFSAVLRWKLAPELALSPDYDVYIKGWSETYRELGFVQGMGQVIGDYYVPLNIMYAIIGLSPWEPWVLASIFSCLFDYLTGLVIFFLVRELLHRRGDGNARWKAAYTAVLFLYLPFVFMNSALWKQCDVIYIFFALLAVYMMFKDRYTLSFILLGVSFSVKLQAVFFIPFFVLLYILKKKFSILQFLWIPGIYLLAGLPAVFCRRGLRATYGTYFLQMMEGSASGTDATPENYGMVAFYPNLYNCGLDDFLETLSLPAVLMTAAILLLSVALALYKRENLNEEKLLWLLAWQIWTCNMFLPSMHERYDYGAAVIFSMLIVLLPKETALPAAVLNIGTFISYLRAMQVCQMPIDPLVTVYIAAFLWSAWALVRGLLRCDAQREMTQKSP
jgi:Gpi18-like mannosyltransferase